MNVPDPDPMEEPSPLSAEQQIDAACDLFEALLKAGEAVCLEDELQRVDPGNRPALLQQLLLLLADYDDLHQRETNWSEYRARFPDYVEVIHAAEQEHALDRSQPSSTASTSLADMVAASFETSSWPFSGELHREYTILEYLGQGGMGTVLLARHKQSGQLVALKILRVDLHGPPDAFARFRHEVEALGKLQHPHIIRVLHVGEHQNFPFYTMEYCSQGSLAERLRQGPLEVDQAVRLLEAIADAVHAAHLAGIVHRDLKPGNILLQSENDAGGSGNLGPATESEARPADRPTLSGLVPKLADFGLAKDLARSTMTGTNALIGSLPYMAPEQIRGKSKSADAAVDIYAMGVLLYECLTGQPPYASETPLETLQRVLSSKAEPPPRLEKAIPRDLETICLHCLNKDPKQRYSTAQALVDDLRRYRTGQPIAARRPGLLRQGYKSFVRHSRPAIIAAAMLVMIGLAWLGWTQLWRTLGRARADAAFWNAVSDMATESPERVSMMLVRSLAYAEESGASSQADKIRKMLGILQHEMLHLRCLSQHGARIFSAAWAPNGEQYATGGEDGLVRFWDALTGKELRSALVHPRTIFGLAYSSDGQHLATACEDGYVRVWDVESGNQLGSALKHPSRVLAVAFSPGGQLLATACQDGKARIWELSDASVPIAEFEHPDVIRCICFGADNHFLATGCDDGQVRFWDLESKRISDVPLDCESPVFSLAGGLSHDWWLAGCQDGTVHRWHSPKNETAPPLQLGAQVFAVSLSPDGDRFVASSIDGLLHFRDVETGYSLRNPFRQPEQIRAVVYSPRGDGLLIVSFDGSARILESSQAMKSIVSHAAPLVTAFFCGDSNELFAVYSDGVIKLFDSNDLSAAPQVTDLGFSITHAAISGNGNKLLVSRASGATYWIDPHTAERKEVVESNLDPVSALTLNHDGTQALIVHRNRTWLYDMNAGKHLLLGGRARTPTFSRDMRYALVTGGWIRVWDMQNFSAESWEDIPCRDLCERFALSPDGKWIANLGRSGRVTLWDFADRKHLVSLPIDIKDIATFNFSPEGDFLMLASRDRRLAIWDLERRRVFGSPWVMPQSVKHLQVRSDGQMLLTVARDEIQLWEIDCPSANPQQLEHELECKTGLRCDEAGTIEFIDCETLRGLLQERQ